MSADLPKFYLLPEASSPVDFSRFMIKGNIFATCDVMNTLFPVESMYPQGFQYLPGFITMQEEADLLKVIANLQLHTFQFQGYEARRRIASFGYDWSFEKQQLSKGKDTPKEFDGLVEKVAKTLFLQQNDFAELLVTEYPAGAVINWHRDAPPFKLIAGISLNSDCTFKLRPHDKRDQGKKSLLSLTVQRRSLYVMQDEARNEWQHSIAPVQAVRYSITLRTLKPSSLC